MITNEVAWLIAVLLVVLGVIISLLYSWLGISIMLLGFIGMIFSIYYPQGGIGTAGSDDEK